MFDFKTLAFIQIAVLGFLESKRYEGYKKTGATGVFTMFPFDPMGMRSPDKDLKELKNGRLAMVSALAGGLWFRVGAYRKTKTACHALAVGGQCTEEQ